MNHLRRPHFAIFFTMAVLVSGKAHSTELTTNHVHMADAPKWLNSTRVNWVVDQIQSKMEWDIRRVQVVWYADAQSYAKSNSLGAGAIAITKHADASIHLGPKVTEANFDQIFGHEIVHVISLQKYKGAIPLWLEEGLANHLSKYGKVNYKWLASQPKIKDVQELVHPFSGAEDRVSYVYMASTALAELIASKCDMVNLLRLSVGRKLENKLANICRIDNINVAFDKWVTEKSQLK